MSTVNPTSDEVLVYRSGTAYSTTADMSTVNNSDLIIVNRSGTDYKCTFADWQSSQLDEPSIDSVSIANVSGGGRFTSTSFPVTLTMDDDGNPASTKQLKAYVLAPDNGQGREVTYLNYLLQGAGISSISVSGSTVTIGLQNGTNLTKFQVGDNVRPFNATLSRDYGQDSFNQYWNTGTFFDGGSASTSNQAYWYPSPGIPYTSSVEIGGGEVGYDEYSINGGGFQRKNTSGFQTLATGSGTLTSFGMRDYRITSCSGGPLRIDGVILRRNVWSPSGVITNINTSTNTITVTNNEGSDINDWSATGNPTICREFDVESSKNTYPFTDPNLYSPRTATKLYCVLDADGDVSNMVEDDPGWVTMNGSSPYSVNFPATLPTQQSPDLDFPAGSRLVVEMRATNTQGDSYYTSNILTPT